MTREEFRARFAEFRTASDDLIESVLAEATNRVDATVFADSADAAIGYLAAHLLAKSPFGKNQRLEDDKNKTNYWDLYVQIRRERVITTFVT